MARLRRQLFPFFLLVAVAILLIALDQGNRIAAPQDTGQTFTQPVLRWFSGISSGVTGWFTAINEIGRLQDENEIMQQQLEQLTLVNVQTIELKEENERLRELLGFQESHPNYTLLAAEIVAQDTPAQVIGGESNNLIQAIRIDQGSEAGIEKGMSVITARGLVGRIDQVGDGWSQVLLLTDETSAVSAYGLEGRASGMVEGTGNGLIMRYVPHEQRVEPNDVVLTSGLGGGFPKGLVIGTIEEVHRSDVNPWQEATIRTTLDISQLEYVFVIHSFVGTEEGLDGR